MTTNLTSVKIDPHGVAGSLQQAVETLHTAEGELVLDFSSVLRIDTTAARALQELADRADARSARVVLRAVNIEIYKALKLLKLAQRFSFLS